MFYGVKVGKQVGVFNTWDECKSMITGYSGAKFKKFKTYEEALAYANGEDIVSRTTSSTAGSTASMTMGTDRVTSVTRQGTEQIQVQALQQEIAELERTLAHKKATLEKLQEKPPEDEVQAYVKGVISGEYGSYGCAVILEFPNGNTRKYAGTDRESIFCTEYGAYFVSAVVAMKVAKAQGYNNVAIHTGNDCIWKYSPEMGKHSNKEHMIRYQATVRQLQSEGMHIRYIHTDRGSDIERELRGMARRGIECNASLDTGRYIDLGVAI